MSIHEIMQHLERGETLMIDDQLRSYIHIERGEGPNSFVVRSVEAKTEDAASVDWRVVPQYNEERFDSLAGALLSLLDWEFHGEGGNPDGLPVIHRDNKDI